MSLPRPRTAWVCATTVLLAAAVAGCVPASAPLASAPAPQCINGASLAWTASESDPPRRLVVALEVLEDSRGAWRLDGRQRLERALATWNGTGIPVRLVHGGPRDSASIRVTVMRRLPLDPADRSAAYRAGVTHLTYDRRGAINGAHVLVAEQTPRGEPYSAADQVATLMHELGHALGLPHSDNPHALMSSQTVASSLTPTDVSLARMVYRMRSCGAGTGITAARND